MRYDLYSYICHFHKAINENLCIYQADLTIPSTLQISNKSTMEKIITVTSNNKIKTLQLSSNLAQSLFTGINIYCKQPGYWPLLTGRKKMILPRHSVSVPRRTQWKYFQTWRRLLLCAFLQEFHHQHTSKNWVRCN